MGYVSENNKGIIALIKRNHKFEFNAIDSSYCVLEDYEKQIENKEYFNWIQDTKLDFELMVKDFEEVFNSKDKELLEKYLIWEKPNIFIDFDNKHLANFYHDRLFEQMVPKSWTSNCPRIFEEFEKNIPDELKYWKEK
jgi:hypothetical protein